MTATDWVLFVAMLAMIVAVIAIIEVSARQWEPAGPHAAH